MQVDPQANVQPLIDPNMITEAIKQHFGVQLRPLDRLVYRKLYPDWVDRIPLPRGYKTPDFSTFSGEDGKFLMEHISHFIAQYDETNQIEYYKLQLFSVFYKCYLFLEFFSYFELSPSLGRHGKALP